MMPLTVFEIDLFIQQDQRMYDPVSDNQQPFVPLNEELGQQTRPVR